MLAQVVKLIKGLFVFGRCTVRISAGTQIVLTWLFMHFLSPSIRMTSVSWICSTSSRHVSLRSSFTLICYLHGLPNDLFPSGFVIKMCAFLVCSMHDTYLIHLILLQAVTKLLIMLIYPYFCYLSLCINRPRNVPLVASSPPSMLNLYVKRYSLWPHFV
jgi:hypothetical protein